ncbi:MAG: excinuclease ABC subunit A [Verrucomicrobia bacterium]|nr:excinuclease ABC subunit A [Verrucomicrobiota bacterium]
MSTPIHIKGARTHNLKNVEVILPRNRLTVITGVSGSGKSSLAFDTLHAEGCRQYLESLSAKARGMLESVARPDVDFIRGRIVMANDQRSRLADSLELAFREGRNRALVLAESGGAWIEHVLSLHLACEHCGETYEDISPRALSHNHPSGACPDCGGLGRQLRFQESLSIRDESLSLNDGAVKPWKCATRKTLIRRNATLRALAEQTPFDLKTPWRDLAPGIRQLILHGDPKRIFQLPPVKGRKLVETVWAGMFAEFEHAYRTTTGESLRQRLLQFQSGSTCAGCHGQRLSPSALSLRLAGKNMAELTEEARRGLEQRLTFLNDAGLNYLTLDRECSSLSGGEAQRVRLATQLGLGLVGVTYVLDEPSIGLHPSDHQRLIKSIHDLRDLGNTIVVVEHDRDMIMAADHLVEMGPGAGADGGKIIFEGTPKECLSHTTSRTGSYLSGRADLRQIIKRKSVGREHITIKGATENNLKNITARFPVGNLTVVCGVSGSGKSTLAIDILSATAARKINGAKVVPGKNAGIEGLEKMVAFTAVDQEPIGRTPRSNPATFTGIMDLMRELWSTLPLAKVRGYGPGRFSFNVRGGRCETCAGEGSVALDMQFLGETFVDCPSCAGRRFNRETLEVRFKGLSISDALQLTVKEAGEIFRAQPRLAEKLRTLEEVGLGYIKLGQAANTLSGGEAQRLKLASELSRRDHAGRLYVLDEPTTGLAWDDIAKLLALLGRLRDAGATLIVIEHHADVILAADWVMELGPVGGEKGGSLTFEGAPEDLLRQKESPTGRALRNA